MKTPAEVAHGPMLIGFVCNVLLYGIMITQVYLYYMKLYVAVLFFADTLNTVFDFVYMYRSLIMHFGKLPTFGWTTLTHPFLQGIIAPMVQVFFAWRVKILTNNHWLVFIIILATLAGGSGGIATAVEVGFQPHFTLFRNFKAVVILWLAADCFADIFINVMVVWHLDLVDRIIRLTAQTGLITSICALLDLIFFLPGTHLIFNFPLSKLYTNSMMSSLNFRGEWKFGGEVAYGSQGDSLPYMMPSTEHHKPDVNLVIHVESHEISGACLCFTPSKACSRH
ncbi:uncharacterized protein BT62DRAFT_982177 [Guyanagaster necrorhizus]|uniref:DUF6534 domain-containing protein n=1 Tax=Guyanagaster necrorhizus TaxID=856835 RepID=A0A9P7VLN2_9AGAR|nr:uncharacterized protein BT62DRAFT_982177 [Guyanagaster necrorhizus MCA 3950]KAG7442974.1 hypothetical protein BT62DRAFT_982177 [Guyanagaster necrorhizus MCA 3950]